LAGTDLETAGQHCTGQDDHDQVALGEVTGPTDDLLGLSGPVGLPDVHPAEADGFFEPGQLLDLEHTPVHDRAREVGAEFVDGLDLQPGQCQLLGKAAGGDVGGKIDILPQPGHGHAHQISLPNAEVKRMSPSTMSRMSRTSCANISVRSIPSPKAQPLWTFGSIPAVTSTRGLTTPQPPISIHPSLEQVRHGAFGSPTEAPRQTKHCMSTSAEGSVKGK